ncbi:MAG: GUN4 domain-containing protein [Microcoleus sp. PH2017_29_MFU_D_A]|uniref:serine/threonine-protein kinase n=1 Tax=unclassified Microcoleus TaxID=2642155 RepID=UPI001D34C616|nr:MULTISPECIES: serine/threonine-protein kinase [unclassified Microcoleus]MCC3582827.1 GUN4 domain-containing protein [Microcoleus sp. PH2017_30_WIL_O_A]MCC3602405.1 GUN4 domain-containing protein [Microcoleus sp. PH2017_29_MFU_D_A]MCC3634679.1 GUN4 domain-containing protein [Microcoleus sp. PH2017_37_MFU_D_B]TAE70462.1 MAG: serine/threonine protein kinase [Oscillatoriales cyanobacterium]
MSYCINPECQNPENSLTEKLCLNCGFNLLLRQRYRPIKLLGRGGFGKTFLAIDEDIPSQPRCALKQFYFRDRDPVIFNKALELFHQEAVRLDELGKHAQIPTLLAAFEQEGHIYLVQEFIDGPTLKEELDQSVCDENQIWQLLQDLLPVLQFIHDKRVIHRDIKPENIIRRQSDNKLVLIDFGIAKLLTDSAILRSATLIGSQDYIAPEQMRGKVFPASDLYSLGVTCIRLMTQVPPLDMYDCKTERWWWREFLPKGTSISAELGEILDKLLQTHLCQRYSFAAEVLQDINAVLDIRQQNLVVPKKPIAQTLINTDNSPYFKALPTSEPPISPTKTTANSAETLSLSRISNLDSTMISAAGVDYTKLRDCLSTKKWKEADRETWAVMCQSLSLTPGIQLEISQIYKLPCEDLQIVDRLWLHYSQGRFGFSVQKEIYESVKGDYVRFCDRVNWQTYNSATASGQLKFTQQAPIGHLPSRSWVGGIQWLRHLDALSAKLTECNNN